MLNWMPLVLLAAQCAAEFGPFSHHFNDFLARKSRRYEYSLKQVPLYGDTGCFGGKISHDEKIINAPVIFVHGNSDSALKFGNGIFSTGWDEQIDHFLNHGYKMSELYGITYGDRNISNSFKRQFECDDLVGHRRFLEAVLEYTNADKVNIIAHSMGVSIARRVIQGGKTRTDSGICDLGERLSDRIGVFLGIAGANYGMCPCEFATAFPACGMETGFFPGSCKEQKCSEPHPENECSEIEYSRFLSSLNKSQQKDAHTVISFWSQDDEILGIGNSVWGRPTSLIPYTDYKKVYVGLKHMEVKTATVKDQFAAMVENFLLLL